MDEADWSVMSATSHVPREYTSDSTRCERSPLPALDAATAAAASRAWYGCLCCPRPVRTCGRYRQRDRGRCEYEKYRTRQKFEE